MAALSFLAIVAAIPLLLFPFASADELLLVQAVWRHGSRNPTHTFPNDVNNTEEHSFPTGFGELTPLGMLQHYHLGRLIRREYGDFLPEMYNYKWMHAISTDFNRTLMSAYSNFAGFFPNGTANHSIPDIGHLGNHSWPALWQPVPVHTVPLPEDNLLWPIMKCPTADKITADFRANDEEYQNITRMYEPFMEQLRNWSGYEPLSLKTMFMLAGPLYIEKELHLQLAPWAQNETVYNMVMKLAELSDYYLFKHPTVARLRAGNLLKELVTNMMNRELCDTANKTSQFCDLVMNRKYNVYSAHDITVYALLRTLRSVEDVLPEHHQLPTYTSALFFELWKTDASEYTVKVRFHKSFMHDEFEPITHFVDGCPNNTDSCQLNVFKDRSAPFMPDDWRSECGLVKQQPTCPPPPIVAGKASFPWLIVLVVTNVLFLLLFLGTLVYAMRMRSSKNRVS